MKSTSTTCVCETKHVNNKAEMKCEGETHVNEMIKVKEMKKMHQGHVSVKRCVQHM